MQNENAATEARQMKVSEYEGDKNRSPSFSGRNVVVYHVTRDYAKVAMEQWDDNHVKPFSLGIKANNRVDLSNYEAVVEIEFKWVESVPSPYMITQNAWDSWSKDRIGTDEGTYSMKLLKPLVGGWGHKSTSIGDLIHITSTDQWFVIDECGYTRLF